MITLHYLTFHNSWKDEDYSILLYLLYLQSNTIQFGPCVILENTSPVAPALTFYNSQHVYEFIQKKQWKDKDLSTKCSIYKKQSALVLSCSNYNEL